MTKWPNSVLGLEKWFSTEGNVSSRDYLAMPGDLLGSHQQREVLLTSSGGCGRGGGHLNILPLIA